MKYNYQQIKLLSGPSRYDKRVFKADLKNGRFDIKNKEMGGIKPDGGLWTSTYNPILYKKHWRHGKDATFVSEWHEWCFSDMPTWIGKDCILITVKTSARIFQIKDMPTLMELYNKYPEVRLTDNGWGNLEPATGWHSKCLDFRKMKDDYDIIHLTSSGQVETRNIGESIDLYGWDCESSLMLNNVIQAFKKVPTYSTNHKPKESV